MLRIHLSKIHIKNFQIVKVNPKSRIIKPNKMPPAPTPKQTLMRAFNNCFFEFMDDIISVLSDPATLNALKSARKNSEIIQSANPSILVRSWYQYVYSKYGAIIDAGDSAFFLEKDYSEDMTNFDNTEHIMKVINTFRDPLKNLSDSNKEMAMKHIQILSTISAKYNELV